jgi:ElaB/YqjD/DUF883 family membrane-anchored ribosome-binding protein
MAYARKRKNGSHELEARIRALKADFEGLQKDMRRLVDAVGESATAGVSSAATAAGDAASSAVEQVEEWAEEGADTVREAIRAQPLAAIAISMGAGAIIGTLLRR